MVRFCVLPVAGPYETFSAGFKQIWVDLGISSRIRDTIEAHSRYHICAAACFIAVGIVIVCRRAFNYIYIEPLVVGIVILLSALFSISIKTPKATIICTSIRSDIIPLLF